MSPRGGMPGALPQNEKKLNYTVISFFWHVSSWKTYDVSSVHVSLSAPPSSNLNSGQIHSSLQTLLTLNQQQTSFPYEILGTKSYQMRVWSLICLYSGGRDIKTLRKPCSISTANQIWIYIFDMRLQSQRKRGELLRRCNGLIAIGGDPGLLESGSDYRV